MQTLEIEFKGARAIRKGIGIFAIITALIYLILYFNEWKILNLIIAAWFLFFGVANITYYFGYNRSYFRSTENGLIIKWSDKLREKSVPDSVIDNITLGREKITVNKKSGKPMTLDLGFLETKQKSEIYKFLIDYAEARNLAVVRDFDKK